MCLLSITLDILNFRIYTKQERGEEEEMMLTSSLKMFDSSKVVFNFPKNHSFHFPILIE